MAQTPVNVGTSPNDGTGDDNRDAFIKLNNNDADLSNRLATAANLLTGKQPLNATLTALSALTITGVGTTANTLAAGNDSRFTGSLQAANNLSDLQSPGTARGNLGLGTLAIQASASVTITGGTINGTAIGGSTSASGSFTTLAATSLTGLTTPLTAGQGGTGSNSLTAALDATFSSTQGALLYRGPSAWVPLAPGTSGQVLTTAGAGAIPSWTTPSAGSASTAIPVRQTALSGPASAGAPSFLPSTTSGTLTLAAQNVSSSAPLIVTAANGFGTAGAIDLVYRFTTNPSWTLTASTTNYLFINASTGATSVQTLAPIYQFGGAASTANGQFTFDWQAMIGYLGNGTTAVVTPLVSVGEAVTSSTAVTSTIAYAYQGQFDSGWTASLPSTVVTRSHNLGVQPLAKRFIAENTTAENGYSVGDQIGSDTGVQAAYSAFTAPMVVASSRLAVTPVQGTNATGWATINKSTAASVIMTLANWRWKLVVQRGW